MDAFFSTSIASSLQAIPLLAEEIQEWGEAHAINKKTLFRANLVLEELITNIICYGHRNDLNKKISLTIKKSRDHLIITLQDEAPRFNPLLQPTAPIHKQLEERTIGGLGIYFVRSLTDHIEYFYTGKGNQLILYLDL